MKKDIIVKYGTENEGIHLGVAPILSDKSGVWISTHIKNNTSDTIYFVFTHYLKNFTLEVRDFEDNDIPMQSSALKEYNNILTSEFHRRVSIKIGPGEEYQVNPDFRLDEWYDLEKREDCQIRVFLKEGLSIDAHPESKIIKLKKK